MTTLTLCYRIKKEAIIDCRNCVTITDSVKTKQKTCSKRMQWEHKLGSKSFLDQTVVARNGIMNVNQSKTQEITIITALEHQPATCTFNIQHMTALKQDQNHTSFKEEHLFSQSMNPYRNSRLPQKVFPPTSRWDRTIQEEQNSQLSFKEGPKGNTTNMLFWGDRAVPLRKATTPLFFHTTLPACNFRTGFQSK